jgi:hypothetical protein
MAILFVMGPNHIPIDTICKEIAESGKICWKVAKNGKICCFCLKWQFLRDGARPCLKCHRLHKKLPKMANFFAMEPNFTKRHCLCGEAWEYIAYALPWRAFKKIKRQ